MERIDGAVRGELGRLGPAGAIGTVVDAWPGAVGPAVARNAWPARIARDGTLHVATSSSAWAFELSQLAPEIAARLRDALGRAAPPALRFAVGTVPEPARDDGSTGPSKRPSPGPEERALADALTAGLADEELRSLVARAAAASLARGADDRSV
jgi:hypothetical protein